MAADYQLPYKPNDPEYIAWETCDAEHSMENLCITCKSRVERIRNAIAAALVQAERERDRIWALVANEIRWPSDAAAPSEENIIPALSGLLAAIPVYQAEVERWKKRVTMLETEKKWEALKTAERERDSARAEVERLKDSVETRRDEAEGLRDRVKELFDENRALEAEVERLKEAVGQRDSVHQAEVIAWLANEDVLRAEVERLKGEFIAAIPKCSTDLTDFQMARLAAQGWKIRAEQAEAALARVWALAQGAAESFRRVANMDDPIAAVAAASMAAEIIEAALEGREK